MSRLALPSVADLEALDPADVPAALLALAALQSGLAARLLEAERAPRPEPTGPERLLTARDAAARCGMGEKWLYRHANVLPFTRRIGRRAMRFSEEGLARWLATRGR